jgi:hypothetical protein
MLETDRKLSAVNKDAGRLAGIRRCQSAIADTLYRRVADQRGRFEFDNPTDKKRTPIIIDGWTFTTKAAVREHCRNIVKSYLDGALVSADDDLFLRALISRHPDADQKTGPGILGFTVATDPIWHKTRGFVLLRTDGTFTDFSYYQCIAAASPEKDIYSALRNAVSKQIIHFKRETFSTNRQILCPYTGILLSPDNCHVDHKAPKTFKRLVAQWLNDSQLSLADIQVTPHADNQYANDLADDSQSFKWQDFHAVHAELRLISRKANLSLAKVGK